MKNKQRFTGLVGVYYYRRPNLIQRILKAMKRALLSLSFIGCFTAAAQNIQILNTDDTVSINSSLNQYVYTLDFVNDTDITRQIAVYDIKYDEFFIFRNNRDGQLAEMHPERLRLANALELYKYNEYIEAFNAGQEMALKSDKISNE